jgi:putative two-component system response regulator
MIVEASGQHFDPDVTDAFVMLFDEFVAIAERYGDTEQDVFAKITSLQGRALHNAA